LGKVHRRELGLAQRKYRGQITIKAGLEFEYLPPFAQWIRSIADMGWDHLLASVHNLLINHRPYLVNGTEGEFKTLVAHFDHNIKRVCKRYYETVQMAAQTGWFDIVGHLDVIKKHNRDERYFSEASSWYRALVIETLDILKQNDIKMEINTAGINHPAGEPYPSKWVIHEAMERDIQIVLGSDAHEPEAVGQYFSKIDQWVEIEHPVSVNKAVKRRER
jgi:histidinol-phosphatase (PHP family)